MSFQLWVAQPGQAAIGRSQEDWGGERAEPPSIPLPTQGSGQPGPVRQVGARLGSSSRAGGSCWSVDYELLLSHSRPVFCLHVGLSMLFYGGCCLLRWSSLRAVLLPPPRLCPRNPLHLCSPRVTAGMDRGAAPGKSYEESDTPVMKSPRG